MFRSEDKLKQNKRSRVRRVLWFVEDLIHFRYCKHNFFLLQWSEAPKFCMLEQDVTDSVHQLSSYSD